MMLRDLRLPDGNTMLYSTGEVVTRDPLPTDLTWDELSGKNAVVAKQPFLGCTTGGDLVADRLMTFLAQR